MGKKYLVTGETLNNLELRCVAQDHELLVLFEDVEQHPTYDMARIAMLKLLDKEKKKLDNHISILENLNEDEYFNTGE